MPESMLESMPESMIETRGLSRDFDGRVAVDGIDLSVAPGELVALLGPNGAGKTTTVRMLTGLIAPTRGVASVAGFDPVRDGAAVRRQVGLLTESPGLYEKLSPCRNLDYFGRLYGMTAERRAARIEETLRLLDLWERRDEPTGGFSRGMKQKLALARAVLHEPSLLFLDEPTSGLDPESALTVRDLIAGLKDEGRTIVLCTHNLEEADRLSDRVGIIRGKLIELDTPANLRARLSGHQVAVRLREARPELRPAVSALPFVREVREVSAELFVGVRDLERDTPDLVRALVGVGADVLSVREVRASLEDVYLSLVRAENGSTDAAVSAGGAR